MIYCVIPRELETELFDKMVEYYKDNPNVTVIVDRRDGDDRRNGREYGGMRETRVNRGLILSPLQNKPPPALRRYLRIQMSGPNGHLGDG